MSCTHCRDGLLGVIGFPEYGGPAVELELQVFNDLRCWRRCEGVQSRIRLLQTLGRFEQQGRELSRRCCGGGDYGSLRGRGEGELAELVISRKLLLLPPLVRVGVCIFVEGIVEGAARTDSGRTGWGAGRGRPLERRHGLRVHHVGVGILGHG